MNATVLPVATLARTFAIAAHGAVGRARKYTGEPYWYHCREVADLIGQHCPDALLVAAGWLHDVLEDTETTENDLLAVFASERLVQWVKEVTDVSKPSDGNRATRKAMDREHLAKASPGGKTIKLADLISNTRSIVQHDPDFARVYLEEKEALLPLLHGGAESLHMLAVSELRKAQAALVQVALRCTEGGQRK